MSAYAAMPSGAQQKTDALVHGTGIVAEWDFGSARQGVSLERISGIHDPIAGIAESAFGPVGPALLMDGYTTMIRHAPLGLLSHRDDFSVSCWLQVEAYPWNDVPILDQNGPGRDFFFGIDAEGHLVASLAGKTERRKVATVGSVPLRQWTFVTLNVTVEGNLSFTVGGRNVATQAVPLSPAAESNSDQQPDLLIGHVRRALLPGPSTMIHPQLPVEYSLQGSLGGLIIYDHLLQQENVNALIVPGNKTMLEKTSWPKFPRGEGGVGEFGAFYTTLKFDPVWDQTRRVGPESDVVVRFPNAPIQLVFWQGANYVPAWVTENNRWYTDEFMETYGHPRCPDGEDCEPMSDKQVRYSHVRILENTSARVVVHWRYALSEVERYGISGAASSTAWGEWADEYWTVYPDGVAVRRQVLWSTVAERDKAEFQESIVLIPAGETPEDSIHFDALTFANLKGDEHSYSWQPRTDKQLALPKGPEHFPEPADAVIQRVNLKSTWKPFQVAWGDPVKFEAYNGEKSISAFEWWNHWPVAQIPSSGRPALAADRPGHTSLSHIYWPISEQDKQHIGRILMTGLTTLAAAQLAPLAESWRTPATAVVSNGGMIRYDASQRAYLVTGIGPGTFSITLHGSRQSPLLNPAFVVEDWHGNATISVKTGSSDTSGEVRTGYVKELEQTKLIAFLTLSSKQDVTITVHSKR
jgi:hypothetical protein